MLLIPSENMRFKQDQQWRAYSGVPNRRASRLFIVAEKIHEFTFIRHYITVTKNARRYDLLFSDYTFIRHNTFIRNTRVLSTYLVGVCI